MVPWSRWNMTDFRHDVEKAGCGVQTTSLVVSNTANSAPRNHPTMIRPWILVCVDWSLGEVLWLVDAGKFLESEMLKAERTEKD